MKKLATLFLAAGMVFAASAPASAVDVKFDGQYEFNFGRSTNQYNTNYQDADYDFARQRMDLGMTFVASENLSGYFQMRAGTTEWGGTASDGAFNADKGATFIARQVYIDWVIPQTSIKVRMGKQFIGLPGGANGKSYVQHAGIAPSTGIVINAPVLDNLDVTAYWARLTRGDYDDVVYFPTDIDGDGELKDVFTPAGYTYAHATNNAKYDTFGLYANYKGNGFSVAPYALYASIDANTYHTGGFNPDFEKNKGYAADAYWFGATATVSAFDPFTFKLGAAYGCKVYNDKGNVEEVQDRDGFVVDALATYKLGFGTVKALAWYGSGDSKGDQKYAGMMPMVGARFNGGSTAWNGSSLMDNFASDWTNPQGTWGIQLGLTGMSFIDGLSHDLTATYFAGTNHKDHAEGTDLRRNEQYLTTEDSGVEVSFNSTYNIYKNLVTFVELGYVFTDFAEKDANTFKNRLAKYEDDWKIAWGFKYKF